MKILSCAIAFALLAAAELPAGQKETVARPARAAKKSVRRAAASTVIAEVLAKNVAIGPKQSKSFDSGYDFSGAEHAAIAVEAPPETDIGTAAFRMYVFWGMPEADWLSCQDVISGEDLAFTNQGGADVSVYGPDLRIEIRNDSDTAITLDQVTVYAVIR